MCGIWAILGAKYERERHEADFQRIRGRGPDLTVVAELSDLAALGFHRLAIVAVRAAVCRSRVRTRPRAFTIAVFVLQPEDEASAQPIVADGLSVVCNGEIYNHEVLKAQSPLSNGRVLNHASDCAAIVHAFRTHDGDLRRACAALDGVFAFVMCDEQRCYVRRRQTFSTLTLFDATNSDKRSPLYVY